MEPNAPILKKTVVTVAVMLSAWVAFVGTVSTVAVLVTTHAVAAPENGDKSPAAAKASDKPSVVSPGSKPGPQRI